MNVLCRAATAVAFIASMSSGAFAQNLINNPNFDNPFSAADWTVPVSANANWSYDSINDNAVFTTASAAGLRQSQLRSNNVAEVSGTRYLVSFVASISNAAAATLTINTQNGGSTIVTRNGTFSNNTGSTIQAVLTTTPTIYSFLYFPGVSLARPLLFDAVFAGAGTTADFIILDDVSMIVDVPELNAVSAVVPLTLFAGIAFALYDRRRRIGAVATA